MAEHDADREPQPIDEEAAWAAIVAGYGEEPADPPGTRPFRSVEDLALPEGEPDGTDEGGGAGGEDREDGKPGPAAAPPEPPAKGLDKPALGSSVVFAPGVRGPRDHRPAEPLDHDEDGSDEGHFVPPEPPPLPEADVTAKFAWLGVVGGPLLLILAAVFGWDMTWWLTTLGVGGFLGGIATLFARMQPDEDDDDPGRGAVV
ncbi:hypothetical protein [Streptomyces sp. NBC_00083]|uniref:hypothetical protein n=1 Tax=Streptomyces sp. NBC_00083 TaxID=2975647 RepID=UPI00225B4DD3|nr:hypothetical protein [Streptomyces sp. NBC_00083]MCX5382926.1 hypothetical protein [Streptomyces sp. NBC_00083]